MSVSGSRPNLPLLPTRRFCGKNTIKPMFAKRIVGSSEIPTQRWAKESYRRRGPRLSPPPAPRRRGHCWSRCGKSGAPVLVEDGRSSAGGGIREEQTEEIPFGPNDFDHPPMRQERRRSMAGNGLPLLPGSSQGKVARSGRNPSAVHSSTVQAEPPSDWRSSRRRMSGASDPPYLSTKARNPESSMSSPCRRTT